MTTTLREAPTIIRTSSVGPELQPSGGTHFRVWAPKRCSVDVLLLGSDGESIHKPIPLESEERGYFSGLVPDAKAGSHYRFRLDAGDSFPDPASHYQPEGPHGPSAVVDHRAFPWTDSNWRGISI